MNLLDNYIKECNLVFTDSVNRLDYNINNAKINYDDSISLFHLVSSFNKLYLSFKKEYEQLPKLNVGKYVSVSSFDVYNDEKDNCYRSLLLYVDKPLITKHTNTHLILDDKFGEIQSYVTSFGNLLSKDYYREHIDMDSSIIKKYLDLFEKHILLLDLYNKLKSGQIFGDGTNSIFVVIDDYENNLLKELKNMKIFISSVYLDTENCIELMFNLGDNFGIDYDNCKIVLNSDDVQIEKEEYNKVLTNIYINKKYTEK